MNYLLIIFAYLVGAIPFGLLIGKCLGVDVRVSGSGNIGATNVNRLLGKKLGALTLFCDMAKGALPMLLARWLLPEEAGRETVVQLCGAAAFLGHLFPIYLGFSGGKGVATALGIFLLLEPLAVGIDVAAFVVVVYLSGYVSIGSMVSAVLMPGLVWLLQGKIEHIVLAAFIGGLIVVKHQANIRRLLVHQEKSWKKRAGDPAS
ncbi:MAG: acyl-phosphate glycerol 3-phosphate acyltransferase [Deltaproteobacteria bacterium RIFOXYD12_FULL_50_9]|nr:MAG: acyl-phosphate glycerol 3-phosphate acyltransferase [Deltaproteobacteria bacterium RIFOXYD12_FULL_50_9]